MTIEDFGWGHFQEQQLLRSADPGGTPARVINVHRSFLHVVAPDFNASLPTPLDLEGGAVTVGDWVLIDAAQKTIRHLLESNTLFFRKAPGTDRRQHLIAANGDNFADEGRPV